MYKLPTYITDNDFNQTQLSKALTTGEVDNTIDVYNNLFLSTDEVTQESDLGEYLIAVPTKKRKNIPEQVETFYDVQFSELTDFIAEAEDSAEGDLFPEIEEEVSDGISEEQLLRAQIDELSDALDEEIEKGVRFKENAAESFEASKSIIISQRIASGEGTSHEDFGDTFPFLPKTEQQKLTDTSQVEKFPFMSG